MNQNGYANRVNILKKIKLQDQWRFAPMVEDSQGRIKWDHVAIDGHEEVHREGAYYIDWYENGRRRRESVGKFPHDVLERARRKRLVLQSEKAGIEIKNSDSSEERRLHAAIDRYLETVKLLKKPSTHLHYRNALNRFKERCSRHFVHMVTRDDILDFMSYLRDLKLDNRTIGTKTMVVIQMLKSYGHERLLKKGDWPRYTAEERPIYTPVELKTFFKSANEDERTLFQFFLQTGFRESEVKHLVWPDIDFREKIVKVSSKPQYGFTPKNWEEREVPVPDSLLERLKIRKKSADPRQELVFPSPGGRPDYHILEKCKSVAWRAKLNCGRCRTEKGECSEGAYCDKFFLHKFRHTFATTHLRDGIDLRTVQYWMGHKDLKSTMVYLKPARGREILSKVNASTLNNLVG